MTAVEFLESQYKFNGQLFKSDFQQAKEMEKEQKQSEYTRGFDDGCQRKQQELDHLRGKNHSCQDNFKNPFKNEPKEQ